MTDALPWPFYPQPKFEDVRGLKTAYRRKGAGEPVVYLHGAGLTRRWLPFHEELSKRADLIAPEHPGYGDTPFPDWLDGFPDLVLHYAEFFDRLGLGKVQLEDGSWETGFICDAWGLDGAEDISRFGGWRAWLASRA